MPFTVENAAIAGSKGGGNRWKNKDPSTNRNKPLLIKLSQAEIDAITSKAKDMEISRVELIVRAVTAYG